LHWDWCVSGSGTTNYVSIDYKYCCPFYVNSFYGDSGTAYFDGVNIGKGGASGSGNTVLGSASIGVTTGTNNTIIGQGITGLSASLSNTIILADGQGNQRLYIDNTGRAYLNGVSSATPTTGILEATDGSGTNIAGAELRFQGGQGTGTGVGGPITFYTSQQEQQVHP
jgi:hypothetical protein